jgi:hypothetical protein
MVRLDRAIEIIEALPEVSEGRSYGNRAWFVGKRFFAWERPFSKADLRRFGSEEPPTGPILAVLTEDLHEKEAVLADAPPGFFTIPHFDGFSGLLIALDGARVRDVREAVVGAWLTVAPPSLAEEYLAR